MAINPIEVAARIEDRFRRYLATTFNFPAEYAELRAQFQAALNRPERLFRGPYLHGLAPYVRDVSLRALVEENVVPGQLLRVPFLDSASSPLYRHQVRAIRRLRAGRNVVVSSGTGSGKTLSFLVPILAGILEKPEPGIHAL